MADVTVKMDSNVQALIDGALREVEQKVRERIQHYARMTAHEEIGALMARMNVSTTTDRNIFQGETEVTLNIRFDDGEKENN